ncbi:O-antigen polymerase [Hymenobacter roseosalivarius DSM 11622]|uniref:O-antigen polymerase n=1 Tax=Hymenobacter roseosalivarius DSM 11622 TaxID=645990 RepID=A0A1W1VS42_9BACT|nr:O-antigen ligase family protein [Hymenobacter roseosalivarius]SMB96177.1 O-antigen polymerase [Hymenobacter roseosalivarius DSM 11622]
MRQAWRQGRVSQYLLLLACVAGVAGLFTSRALVALSPLVGVAAAVANPNARLALTQWLRNKSAWGLALLYFLLVVSGLYTEDWSVWQHQMYRQLPLIGVPLAFALAVPLSARQRYAIGCLFVAGGALIGGATVVRYLLNPLANNELIMVGQNTPSVTGIFHIHFGLMLALAVYFGLLLSRSTHAGKLAQILLVLGGLFSAMALHILAYRTGLLVLYTALLVNGAILIVGQRRFLLGGILLAFLIIVPFLTYNLLTSFRYRVLGTAYDIAQFSANQDINTFSVSQRFAAWETARVVATLQPWVGVGMADVRVEMMRQYEWRDYGLEPANRVMIHNQYLHYLVGGGVIGLFLWLLVLLGPLAQPSLRRNPYVIHFLVVMGTGMLVDSLLELQIGFNLFVFLYSFLLVAGERHSQEATANLP